MGADRKRASVGACLVTRDILAALEVDELQRRAACEHRDVTCNPHGVEPLEMGQKTPKNDETVTGLVSKRRLNQRASEWECVKRLSVEPRLVTRDLLAVVEVDGLQRRAARKHLDVACHPHVVES